MTNAMHTITVQWFQENDLSKHVDALASQGVHDLEDLWLVDAAILKECGLNPIERNRFTRARNHLESYKTMFAEGTMSAELVTWLKAKNLERWSQQLEWAGFCTFDDLKLLDDEIMNDMGFTLFGKKKLVTMLKEEKFELSMQDLSLGECASAALDRVGENPTFDALFLRISACFRTSF